MMVRHCVLYVNGNPTASATVSGNIETNSSALRVGGDVPYGEDFRGRIGEVAFTTGL